MRAASRIHALAVSVEEGGESGPGPAATDALATLLTVVPFDCALIARWHPKKRQHTLVANIGYPDEAVCQIVQLVHTAPPSRRAAGEGRMRLLSDIPPASRGGPIFANVIQPLDFSDGVSLCLTTGGRCVGAMHANTVKTTGLDGDAVALLRLISRDLSVMADPFSGNLGPHLELGGSGLNDAVGIFAWDETADRVVPLTSAARPELVARQSPLRGHIATNGRRGARGLRLVALIGRELLEIDVTVQGRWVLCEHRPIGGPMGLTVRELEVLVEVAEGKSNRLVATSLKASEWTIMTHMEHILSKLGVANRTGAAAEAARLGLVRVTAGSWWTPTQPSMRR